MLKYKDENDLKVCDFEKNGNVIRLYLTILDDNDYGDFHSWGICPYEHNADTVGYNYYPYIEIAFPLHVWVTEPADDYHYQGNSPYCKDDFKMRKAPCILIGDLGDDWHDSYSEQIGNQNLLRIYYNDKISDIIPLAAKQGGLVLTKNYWEDGNV